MYSLAIVHLFTVFGCEFVVEAPALQSEAREAWGVVANAQKAKLIPVNAFQHPTPASGQFRTLCRRAKCLTKVAGSFNISLARKQSAA